MSLQNKITSIAIIIFVFLSYSTGIYFWGYFTASKPPIEGSSSNIQYIGKLFGSASDTLERERNRITEQRAINSEREKELDRRETSVRDRETNLTSREAEYAAERGRLSTESDLLISDERALREVRQRLTEIERLSSTEE